VIFVEDGFGEVAAEVTRRRWQRKGETSAYTPGDASTSASVSEVKAVAISRPVSVSSSLEGLESSGRWYMPDAGGSRDSPGDGDQPSGLTLSRADLALVLLAEVRPRVAVRVRVAAEDCERRVLRLKFSLVFPTKCHGPGTRDGNTEDRPGSMPRDQSWRNLRADQTGV
jgi:hypothetical protein